MENHSGKIIIGALFLVLLGFFMGMLTTYHMAKAHERIVMEKLDETKEFHKYKDDLLCILARAFLKRFEADHKWFNPVSKIKFAMAVKKIGEFCPQAQEKENLEILDLNYAKKVLFVVSTE